MSRRQVLAGAGRGYVSDSGSSRPSPAQCAASSSATGNGSDLGLRAEWLPLFDRYQVDLVLSGHDHDYERWGAPTPDYSEFETFRLVRRRR
jgi:hypothetical protein